MAKIDLKELPARHFSIAELVECAMREIDMRRSIYPGLMRRGRMEDRIAFKELGMMIAIRDILEGIERDKGSALYADLI